MEKADLRLVGLADAIKKIDTLDDKVPGSPPGDTRMYLRSSHSVRGSHAQLVSRLRRPREAEGALVMPVT